MIRRRPKVSRRQLLSAVPHRNPDVEWQELDSGGLMVVYKKTRSGPKRWLRMLFALPEIGQLALDETGRKVVGKIDGKTTVNDLIAYVAEDLKLSRKESEVSLLKYLELLGGRGLIWLTLCNSEVKR